MKFELNKVEEERWEKWKKTLPLISDKTFGFVGGGYWFKFIPTGIGTLVYAGRLDVPHLDIDLTDYDLW